MPKKNNKANNVTTKLHSKQQRGDLEPEVDQITGSKAYNNEAGSKAGTKASRQKRGSSNISPVNQAVNDIRNKKQNKGFCHW